MRLFGKLDKEEKVNPKLLTLISLLPIVCSYSFLRIRIFRKMFVINLIALAGFITFVFLSPWQYDKTLFLQFLNYGILPGIDAIFVWHYSQKWNKRLLS